MEYTYSDYDVSDLHKDAYGFRPSQDFWEFWSTATPDQKQAEWDSLCESLKHTIAEEKEQQDQAIWDFETRIADLRSMGAKDRNMAIRWIIEGLERPDIYHDFGYGCFVLGLPYSYTAMLKEAHQEK